MLNVITVSDAVKLIKENFSPLEEYETVTLDKALGRTVSEDIKSTEDVPCFDRSTMDGYAVFAADTYGAGESIPAFLLITGEVLMGENADFELKRGCCVKISTGGMLPRNADAVVPVENTEEDIDTCLCFKTVSPFENVTRRGDDIKENEIIIKRNTRLNAAHIGLLASCGTSEIRVSKRARVGIISTGNEITALGEAPEPGKIREVNSHTLDALCNLYGCETKVYGTVRDEYSEILAAVKKSAAECDCVLISGGSSAGTKDMTVKVIDELGTVYAHGIAMKPGKPTIIGKIGNKAVFGLPGHPAACFFVTEVIVKELLNILNRKSETAVLKSCVLCENISSNHGREDYVCVKINGEEALPVYGKSGILSTLCEADGYIVIERNREGLVPGDCVEVHPFGGKL